jgi:hypothetical protein
VRASRTCIASVLIAAALAGCGSGDHKQPGLTNGEAQALIAQLQAARASAAARDPAGTNAALANFRRSVARLRRDGALSARTARALRIGAQRVAMRVASDSAPAPAPTTTTPAPAPTPTPPGQAKKKHDKKHHKGPGKKHGEEGD